MANHEEAIALAIEPTDKQRLFVRYTLAILIDLAVLGLFNEYWDKVHIEGFTIALMTAVLMQVLLQATFKVEHRVRGWFKSKSGTGARVAYYFTVWLILFGSKLVILGAIEWLFGDQVRFIGWFHGLIPFISVIITMLVVEGLVARIYQQLGNKPQERTA